MSNSYVTDQKEWTYACSLVKSVATWRWRPNRDDKADILYTDSDAVRIMGIMPFLTELCNSTNDSSFYFMMLEPDPIGWFHKNTGVFPLIKIDSRCSESKYASIISTGVGQNSAWSVPHCASIITLFPDTLNWHIFSQDEPELARIACCNQLPAPIDGIPVIVAGKYLESSLSWIEKHPDICDKPLLC